MIKKLLLFSLITYINSFTIGFSIFPNYKDVVYNPYRVFRLPPWTSMKKIKKKYNELVKKYHPDKSHSDTRKQFELIQKSYDLIKKMRKENEENEEEMNFPSLIVETIRSIMNVEIIFFAIYMIASITYRFQRLIAIPLFYMIISFTFIDNMLPHIFSSETKEYITCIIIGIILITLHNKYKK